MSLISMQTLAGHEARVVTDALVGSVEEAARFIVEAHLRASAPVLHFGGETTVKILNLGLGGRNQELALWSPWRQRDAAFRGHGCS